MKNISLRMNSINVAPPMISPATPIPPKITNINLSVQFDNEAEALAFTKYMLDNLQNYKAGGV